MQPQVFLDSGFPSLLGTHYIFGGLTPTAPRPPPFNENSVVSVCATCLYARADGQKFVPTIGNTASGSGVSEGAVAWSLKLATI